ncbi:putative protein RSN1 [Talaromyces islandicus]|uniref:DUF221-domain-containing protein n=1 Tax=Talaromyces islandicus TaxID=28573 RepID=A0A0U1MB80_TALIS|nr:putative protein RSN1 [Talaromyces islandicus]
MDGLDWNRTLGHEAGKAQRDQNLSVQSFLVSLIVSAGIFVIAVIAFPLLKDRYPTIYKRSWSPGTSIPDLPSGPWAWIWPVATIPDETIIRERGLDAFLLLRLLRTAFLIVSPLALVLIPVLVPLNITATSHLHELNASTGLNRLSWSNLQAGQWSRYWGQVSACVAVVLYIGLILTQELRLLRRLRREALLHPRSPSSARSILVTDIPPHWVQEGVLVDRLRDFFTRFHHGDVIIHPVRDYRSVTNKVARRNQLADLLEESATRQMEHDARLNGSQRPHPSCFRRRWRWRSDIPGAGRRFDIAEDARKIKALTHEIEEALEEPSRLPLLPCAVLQFSNPVTAHIVCQVVHTDHPFHLAVHRLDSIEDDQTLWSHADDPWRERLFNRIVTTVCIVILSVFWILPISLTGFLSQLAALSRGVPWARGTTSLPPSLLVTLQGILPQLALTALMNLFPSILTVLVERQAYVTRAEVERSLQSHYFLFLYLQVFLVVSIASAITVVLPALLDSPRSTPLVLAENLPKASNYFLSYLLLSAFTQCAALLLRPWDWLSRWSWPWSNRSPRARWKRETTPAEARLGLIVPVITNLICLAIIFSVIAPLILACAAIAFGLLWVTYRYLVLYVLVIPVNSSGLLHWRALHQLFVGLYTFELCQVGLFALASADGPLLGMILAVGGTAIFHYLVLSRIRPTIEYLPSDVNISGGKMEDLKITVSDRIKSSLSRAIWIPNSPIADQIQIDVPVSSAGLSVDSLGFTRYECGPPDM